MASRVVELTQTQSIVLGTITKHKCISALECAYWTKLTESEIEKAIPVLEKNRLIYKTGGYPKRYCPRLVAKKEEEVEDDNWVHPDVQYEAVAAAEEIGGGTSQA